MGARSCILTCLVLVVSACDITSPQQTPAAWDVVITGTAGFPDLAGTAGVASQLGTTTAVMLVGGVPNGRFTWRIHRGTCQQPGAGVGAVARYPDVVLNANGSPVELTASIHQMLEPNGDYIIVLRAESGDTAGCGGLVRFQG